MDEDFYEEEWFMYEAVDEKPKYAGKKSQTKTRPRLLMNKKREVK